MNCKQENLARIYYAIEQAARLLEEGIQDFSSVRGNESVCHELEKINRLMEIVHEDMLELLESEVI